MNKKIISIAGAIVLLGTLVTMCFAVNAYFAKDAEVQLLSMRLDNKIIQDQIYDLQKRIWALEDRYQGKQMPNYIRDEIRIMRKEIEDLNRKLKKG